MRTLTAAALAPLACAAPAPAPTAGPMPVPAFGTPYTNLDLDLRLHRVHLYHDHVQPYLRSCKWLEREMREIKFLSTALNHR